MDSTNRKVPKVKVLLLVEQGQRLSTNKEREQPTNNINNMVLLEDSVIHMAQADMGIKIGANMANSNMVRGTGILTGSSREVQRRG